MNQCYKPKPLNRIQEGADEYLWKDISDRSIQDHFIAGAEWMQAMMQESNEGQALLYAVEKTAERTKSEMIEKAAEWLSNNMFHSINHGIQINGLCIQDFIGRFKQAMQDESNRSTNSRLGADR